MTAHERYAARIHRVVDYIDEHLASDLSLDELADVASFSKYHFHRVFQVAQGETLFGYIRRLRLERAARLLLARPRDAVLAVALDSGFENASAFARAFRDHFGVSATEWRIAGRAGGTEAIAEAARDRVRAGAAGLGAIRDSWPTQPIRTRWEHGCPVWESSRADGRVRRVRVRDQAAIDLAYVRHVGPYEADEALFERLFERLITWATPRGFVSYPMETYCVYHDAPRITPDDKLRVSAGLPVPSATRATDSIGRLTIPAGRYARAQMELSSLEYGEAWAWTYGWWLPQSGYEPDDRPPFEYYRTESPDDDAGDHQVVEICVPVRAAR